VVDVVAAVDGEPDGEVVDGTVVGGTVVAGSEELVETLVVVLAASLSVPRFWLSEDRSSREQPETVGEEPAAAAEKERSPIHTTHGDQCSRRSSACLLRWPGARP
jgi:hypothetical protein